VYTASEQASEQASKQAKKQKYFDITPFLLRLHYCQQASKQASNSNTQFMGVDYESNRATDYRRYPAQPSFGKQPGRDYLQL